ncbi:MAG: ABC transporter ATP-binding protein [Burkholderiales bacterium]
MVGQGTLLRDIGALLGGLPARRRGQLGLLIGLMLAGALAEVLSLGAVVPFLAVLTDPVLAMRQPFVGSVISFLGLTGDEDLRWTLTLLFGGAAVAAGAVRILLIYVTARLNFGIGHELGAEVYRRSLYQPYEVHVSRNSSTILGGLNKVDVVVWVVFNLLTTCSAVLMAACIVVTLLFIDAQVALAALLGFGGVYVAVTAFTRKRLARNSEAINRAYDSRVQTMQEGLGGIRDVLLDKAQGVFARRFVEIDWPMRQAQASNNFIAPSPRFVVEALGMVLIALLAYYLTAAGGGVVAAIPALGALALGAQRLMPLLQQAYQGWVYVAGNRQLLGDVAVLLRQPVSSYMQADVAPMPFEHQITLDKVSFRYQPAAPLVLDDVSLAIARGSRVGLTGTTGSGKSTLMDLLMGLLEPASGRISVDGQALTGVARLAWQHNIAHVPQAIFLLDASFAENIAFGVDPGQVDMARVRAAARQAQIAEFIEAGPMGYEGLVGERGVRLSGGQRQRVGIARALYKQAKVLVFDEATSALDDDTEAAVMQAINGLGRDLTIVLIAHRVSTLQGCDIIHRLDQGRVAFSGSYDALLATLRHPHDGPEHTHAG